MTVVNFPPRREQDMPPEDDDYLPEPPPGRFDDESPPGEQHPARLPFLWVSDFGDLHRPPPLRWLLSDLRTRKPFLRAGKCAVLGGDGGVGKGFFWLTLAVCIATGRDLFETFRPEQSGRVAILAAEDDQQEIHHRLNRIANALALGTEEIELVRERIGIFPLAGAQVNLLTVDSSRAPQRTPVFEMLVDQLAEMARDGDFEWSLIGLDPLARFGAANVESEQSAATAFVQALESMASRLPGEPAIGVTQHSSAASVSQGRSNIRGVTGLRNAFRVAMILDAFETKDGLRGVLLRNDKNNLGPIARPLWLTRMENEPLASGWLEIAGVLRRANEDEIQEFEAAAGMSSSASREQREQAKQAQRSAAFDADCMKVLAAVPAAPAHATMVSIDSALRAGGDRIGDKTLKGILEFLASPAGGSRIVDLSSGAQSKPRQWARQV
jgi:hypothetical protein